MASVSCSDGLILASLVVLKLSNRGELRDLGEGFRVVVHLKLKNWTFSSGIRRMHLP